LESLRIAWFNWRCIKHPEAGGAEVFTHEVARRLVKMGHEVNLVTSRPKSLSIEEEICGYRVLRSGGKLTVYMRARKIYEEKLRGKVDLVIDEINTVPFFTVKYVREPVVALIHQLAREYWLLETPPPFSWLGYVLEPRYLKLYREVPTITVSRSTRKDLKELGFRKVWIVPEGLSVEPLDKLPEKNKEPTLIFLGRFRKTKRPDHVLRAFNLLVKEVLEGKLLFVGDGPLREKMEKMSKNLGLGNKVVFYGKVCEDTKIHLLRKSWILVFPAIREGWGLVVTEANAQATPTVGYDVPGVRDSVINGETGILVPPGNIEALAKALMTLLIDRKLRMKMSENALNWSKQFNWNKSAKKFLKIIKGVINEK